MYRKFLMHSFLFLLGVFMALTLLMSIAGCGKDDNSTRATITVVAPVDPPVDEPECTCECHKHGKCKK